MLRGRCGSSAATAVRSLDRGPPPPSTQRPAGRPGRDGLRPRRGADQGPGARQTSLRLACPVKHGRLGERGAWSMLGRWSMLGTTLPSDE